MSLKQINWSLININDVIKEIRHCSTCGKDSTFTDTLIRRHNANGKNIYRYAIFKCERNHTWNKKLETYKSFTDHVRLYESYENSTDDTPICLKSLINSQVDRIEITIDQVIGDFRIDKVLSERFMDISRNNIVRNIKDGWILLNGKNVKPSSRLRCGDRILVNII
ncbi:S4 domain-containing protein [Bacillus spongiae]|uniref:S4 domain-containing protein n=1 Tax=Bacillus spongiae TaxID=2683610 RepID=A0ABU8HHL9_9BACI